MFPLKKLGELSPRTRLRKATLILQALEIELVHGRNVDNAYLAALAAILENDAASAAGTRGPETSQIMDCARALVVRVASGAAPELLLRAVNALRHATLTAAGAEPAEWDMLSADTGALDRSETRPFPISAFLEDIRSPYNVGAMMRTAEAFGLDRIFISPRTPHPTHPRARKTSRGAEAAIPWEVKTLDAFAARTAVFALELGGVPIDEFHFPETGVVLVGSEELGLSPEALGLADASLGRVSIPLSGAKRSLNVSVAFGILVSRWCASLRRRA